MAGLVIAGPCPPLFRSETTSEDDYLEPLMQNFLAWYRYAVQENMGAIPGLFGALGEVLPGFESMDLAESGENTRALKVAFCRPTDEHAVDRYGFGQLSDGQKVLIALYGLVFLSTSRRVSLFLDELDNYLALREVQPWLAEVVGRCGGVLDQAVVASHHPVTIDYMAGAKGRWLYRDGNGPVRVSNEPQRTVDGISLSETVARGWGHRVSGVGIALLCEDSQTDAFVRRFLKHRNFRGRDIRTLPFRAVVSWASSGFENGIRRNCEPFAEGRAPT